MLDQAQKLRQLALNKKSKNLKNDIHNENSFLNKKSRIITVYYSKSDIKNDKLILNLSVELQRLGKKVLIFDANREIENDKILMGFISRYTIFDAVSNKIKLQDILTEGPLGIKLLPGGMKTNEINKLTNEQKNQFLNEISLLEQFDYILIDIGSKINKTVLGFIASCEELIVITTPESKSLIDAYSLIKSIYKLNIKSQINIIVDKVTNDWEGEDTFNKFYNAVNKFLNIKINYLGKIFEDRFLIQSIENINPFTVQYFNSNLSKDLNNIALNMINEKTNKYSKDIRDLFKNFFSIFS